MLRKLIGLSVIALLPISLLWAAFGITGIAGRPTIIVPMLISVLIALVLLSLIAGWIHDR